MGSKYDEGKGYEGLHMPTEARLEYNRIGPDDPEYLDAQLRLMLLGFPSPECEREAERGLELLKRYPENARLISDTALGLHLAGKTSQAYELFLAKKELTNWPRHDLYGFACYASKVGEWEIAAESLLSSLRKDGDYEDYGFDDEDRSRAFIDVDLEPFWKHCADEDLSARVALAIGNPRVAEVMEVAKNTKGELPIDHVLLQLVPETLRAHLKLNISSTFFWMPPQAPSSIRQSYLNWQQVALHRNISEAEKGIKRAAEFILNHQLDWAIKAAKVGNLLGSRYHAMFTLVRRPEEFISFAQALRPLGLGYFLDEAGPLLEKDPQLFLKLDAFISALVDNRCEEARNCLDEMKHTCSESALFKISLGLFEQRQGHFELAARYFLEAAQLWPEDPAAFLNAAENLMHMGNWKEAERVLNHAPKSSAFLKHFDLRKRQLLAKDLWVGIVIPAECFYGQPDIGGRIMMPSNLGSTDYTTD